MNELPVLAARVREDASAPAVAQFRKELEARLLPMVRTSIRRGRGSSSVSREILQELEKVAGDFQDRTPEEQETLSRWIARRLCDRVIGRLRVQEEALETVCKRVERK